MSATNYGQIGIFDEIFYDLEGGEYSPSECMLYNKSYVGTSTRYPNRNIPIMLGSKLHRTNHPDDMPLGRDIVGYFIVGGLAYTVNNIKQRVPCVFGDSWCRLGDQFIELKGLMKSTVTNQKSKKPRVFRLPMNWRDIAKFSEDPDKLTAELEGYAMFEYSKTKYHYNKDKVVLAAMYDTFFGITKPSDNFILKTAGNLFADTLKLNNNIIKCFETGVWPNDTSVSERVKITNRFNIIESVRRVTYRGVRERMSREARLVADSYKNKLCPVQTSSGPLCGTVLYLVDGATIDARPQKFVASSSEKSGKNGKNGKHVWIDNVYMGLGNLERSHPETVEGKHYIFCTEQCYVSPSSTSSVSVTASCVPYILNNPPIRAMFTCSMMKQALSSEPREINDYKYVLKSDVPKLGPDSFCGESVNIGRNVLQGVMPWYGYNIEDALVISETCARMFRYVKVSVYKEDGIMLRNLVDVGDKVDINTPLYAVFNPDNMVCVSIVRSKTNGVVKSWRCDYDHVQSYCVVENAQDLSVGDKLSSRHGQKGVVSLVVPDADMPKCVYNNKPRTLDILMNPHAFPSRMTMGHIKELGNYTVKTNVTDNEVVVGEVYYMALRHQVSDKVQFRANTQTNNNHPVYSQPVKGRSKGGGLRVGQMERDILIAMDAWPIIEEFWGSDYDTIIRVDSAKMVVDAKSYNSMHLNKIYQIENPDENMDLNRTDEDPCSHSKTGTNSRLIRVHKYFAVILSLLRGMGRDIEWDISNNTYSVVELDKSNLINSPNLSFGVHDVLDVRLISGCPVLPICLRTPYLDELYKNPVLFYPVVKKVISKMITGKYGVYHQLVEGHRINNCIRSVIVPDPTLDVFTVKVPKNAEYNYCYGLLNRQPSLKETSMVCVRLIQGQSKAIHINPQLCSLFNADFDGDEMNIYGLLNRESINCAIDRFKFDPVPVQDYLLMQAYNVSSLDEFTKLGVTASMDTYAKMVETKSKGRQYNIDQINSLWMPGVSKNKYYTLAKDARESAVSISINTPITGYIASICNEAFT